ncbi:hypothetical protein [Polaromonas sp. YR568]|uniref:hypothetical protein n=1 Tax=Polaromonas sp. YR568 TaxID=1855301 RepID=UPI003137E1C7
MPRFSPRASRFYLLALACLGTGPALALDLPNPAEPEAQALVKRFQADYARIKADPNFFKPPAAPVAMPCEVPQRDLYTPLGLFMAIPEEAEKIRLMSRKQLRDMGMDPDTAAKPMQYSNIRITPLKAACKDGKLEGDTDFLVQFDTLMENVNNMDLGTRKVKMTMKMGTQQASRYFLTFKDGKVQDGDRYHVTQLAMRNETLYDDAQMTQTMAKTKIPDAPEPQVTLNYMNFGAGRMAMFTVSMAPKISAGLFGVNTSFQQQLDSHFTSGMNTPLQRMVMYKNDKVFMTSQTSMKNGKAHGEQVQTQENYLKASGMRLDQVPGMETARLVTVGGVEMIETRTCFIEGVLTKAQTCPKD